MLKHVFFLYNSCNIATNMLYYRYRKEEKDERDRKDRRKDQRYFV